MHQFNEHHPEFEGFSAFYEAEIWPGLQDGELTRRKAVSKIKIVVPVIAVGTVLLVAAAFLFGASMSVLLVLGIVGTFIALGVSDYFGRRGGAIAKPHITNEICRFLGCGYNFEVDDGPAFKTVVGMGLITAHYTREIFQNLITGSARGATYVCYDVHLQHKESGGSGKIWVTKFRGQVLAFKFDRKFLGRTVVLRDKGALNSKKVGDMQRVGLVDPVFEKIFEVYGTDQVEARQLLTPTFMQRLIDLEETLDGKNLRFGFNLGYLLVVHESRDQYASGSVHQSLTETARTQNVLNDFGAIYDVIDGVLKRPTTTGV